MVTKFRRFVTTFMVLLGSTVFISCGQDICIAGIGACSTAGLPASGGGSSPTGTLQIDATTWPRETGHVVVSNTATSFSSLLYLVVTGGTQPYQTLQFYTTGSNQGTLSALTSGTGGFTATFTAPVSATPSVVIMVQDSSNPVQSAYLPLTIDSQ